MKTLTRLGKSAAMGTAFYYTSDYMHELPLLVPILAIVGLSALILTHAR